MGTRTLLISPLDVGMTPLGPASSVTDVEIAISYDRDVIFDGGDFVPGQVPLVETTMPDGGYSIDVVPNDDPSITAGQGFSILVTTTYRPRRGLHRRDLIQHRRIAITSADPDIVPLGAKGTAHALPQYGDYGANSGVGVWVDPDTGERIPYLTSPSLGVLTTIGT